MTSTSWSELKRKRLDAMTEQERAEYRAAHSEARLAAEVGEQVRAAREAAGLSQRAWRSAWGPARQRIATWVARERARATTAP